jgi:hypothetical protein
MAPAFFYDAVDGHLRGHDGGNNDCPAFSTIACSSGAGLAHGFAAIAERFGDVRTAHGFGAFEIGDGPRNLQRAMESARRKAKRFGGMTEQSNPGFIRRCGFFEKRRRAVGVGSNAFGAECCESRALAFAGRSDTGANILAPFAWRR